MKKLYQYKFLVFALFLSALSSCLKDKSVDNARFGNVVNKDDKIAEIAGPVNGINPINLDAGSSSISFTTVTVRLASEKPADKDIQVTLALDPAQITSYNTANGTNYVSLPSSLYSFEGGGLVVTIPAGSREGQLKTKLIPDNLIGAEYALGFTITTVSDAAVKISGNYKKQLILLGVKNKYDGVYSLKGAFYHPTASPSYGRYTTTVELHTVNGNTVNLFWPLLGGFAHPILSGSSFSYFASQEAGYSVNAATNGVTVSNLSPTGTVVYSMGDNYTSRYETGTRTFYVQFGYNHFPGGVFNPAATREWTDTLTYTGPR